MTATGPGCSVDGMTAPSRLVQRIQLAVGGAYVRVVAVGGAAAVPFLVVWPVSTIIVIGLVAVVTPALDRRRRRT